MGILLSSTPLRPPAMNAAPYFSEDRDTLWFKRSEISYRDALKEAAMWARETFDEWGRARYAGKEEYAKLHDCDDWPEVGDDDACPEVPAWRFEIYEKGWSGG